jgi:hypothetical protein
MFEVGFDQAAGLRADPVRGGPAMMPVASPAQPARAYEMLCTLAAHLKALGRVPVIIDGTAIENTERHPGDGSPPGLLHALLDPSISGLCRPSEGHEWLVMPGALGLKALQQTARTAGGTVALSRLLAPFAAGGLVLLFAPPQELSPLFSGLAARVLVPVLSQPQSSIDAYGALKLLSMAGATPVLAPMESDDPEAPLQQVLNTVADCAQRHLKLEVETWTEPVWGQCVLESALGRPVRLDTFHGLRDPRFAGLGRTRPGALPTLWS